MMDIADLRKRFKWTKDGFDSYRILRAPEGPLEGDCDDFAITALWLAEGKSLRRAFLALWRRRAAIWRTRTDRGGRHAVLWHGRHGWIENGAPRWKPELASDLTLVRKRWVIEVALKMLVGKVMK
jgi:hypothetical protein